MIVDNTQVRLISCSFNTDKGIRNVMLSPGHNVVDSVLVEDMLKHPGVKNKLAAGVLVIHEPKVEAKPKKTKAKAKVKAEVIEDANNEG